ncbi:synaptonemal complex central element protein 1-like [Sarcophilus harrisii]
MPPVSLEEAQLKEVLSKKQETLRTLSLHCQEKEIEALRSVAPCLTPFNPNLSPQIISRAKLISGLKLVLMFVSKPELSLLFFIWCVYDSKATSMEGLLGHYRRGSGLLASEFPSSPNLPFSRQLVVTKRCKKRITELSSKIQEERLKKRQQRMEFGQQLYGMMEKHKVLWEFHMRGKPLRANTRSQKMSIISRHKEQLLKEERRSQEKLGSLQAQVDALSGPEGGAEAAGASGEDTFLRSAEAAAAVQLFEEENKKATEFLEAAALHYRQLQQKYQRMKRQLEAVGHSGTGESQERSPEGAAGGKSSVVTKAVMEIPKKDQQVKPGIGHPAGSSQREVHGESEHLSPL